MTDVIYVAKIVEEIKIELENTYGEDWIIEFAYDADENLVMNAEDANLMLDKQEYDLIVWNPDPNTPEIGAPRPRRPRKY